jgi:hypothetical protein
MYAMCRVKSIYASKMRCSFIYYYYLIELQMYFTQWQWYFNKLHTLYRTNEKKKQKI